MGKITEIKKGDEFLCILDSKIPRFYTAGKTYVSDEDDSIRDNLDDCKHMWDIEAVNKHFVKLEKTMVKKYRLISEDEAYYPLTINEVYPGDLIPDAWDNSVEYHANMYPKEWEEVIEPEVEKKEILDAVNSKALRYNQGKPQYSLIDLKSLESMAKVLEFGANKYARNNWKKGMPITKILDSMLRHIAALQSGEWLDSESGLPHIGHIQCNALFLGGPNVEIDIEELKQESTCNQIICCGNWDSEGICKCKKDV